MTDVSRSELVAVLRDVAMSAQMAADEAEEGIDKAISRSVQHTLEGIAQRLEMRWAAAATETSLPGETTK